MNILLFGGFLGSGKTTTILQVAHYITEVKKETAAIIENEIGEAGIDDKLLSDSGLQVRPLFGGCVCCQITSDLITAIEEIKQQVNPDWLIVEMTGLAVPGKTAKLIEQYCQSYSSLKTVTLVDGGRWAELMEMLEPLIVGQIKDSNLIILNKADLAGNGIDSTVRQLREIDGKVKVVITSATDQLPQSVIGEVLRCE